MERWRIGIDPDTSGMVRAVLDPAGEFVLEREARGCVETERARIRQLALDRAERWLADGSEFAAQALRELAAELEER